MAWTTPRTWVPGELVTANMLNVHLRDNMNALFALIYAPIVTMTDAATVALDAALGFVFRLVAAGNRTIAAPSNARSGQKIIVHHLASGGARTLALTSGTGGFRFGSDITSLTATASGKTDYIGAVYSDPDSRWDVVAVVKGY